MAESMTPDRICTCQPFFSGHVTEHPDCPRGQAEIAARAAAPGFTDEEVPVGPDRNDEPNKRSSGPAPDRAGLREAAFFNVIETLTRTSRVDWDDESFADLRALLSEPPLDEFTSEMCVDCGQRRVARLAGTPE